jgi:hypothetical protein
MNNSPIRKFCESRFRWLIVATATGVIALAAVLPLVDEYCDNNSSRSGLAEELVRARETAAALPQYEKRAAAIRQELEALEARTVDDSTLASFRSRLVDIVHESGCQIRQIDVGSPVRRPWTQGDDPLREAAAASGQNGATPFSLERRSVLLSVDGAMPAIHDLLGRLEQEHTLSHPHRVQMQASTTGGENVMLELELWLFALARTPS